MSEDSVVTDNKTDGFTKVGLLCKKHIRNLFFGHLNIKSLKNKREYLETLIRNSELQIISQRQKSTWKSFDFLRGPGYSL